MVTLQCVSDVTQWSFNNGGLLDSVYTFTNYFLKINLIFIVIQNVSYFGEYKCMGEVLDEDIAFYDFGTLKYRG